MSTTYFYVRPTDSLFVRGNQAFGNGGEHGGSLMPPPPSLFAGAFRSAILGKDAAQMTAFLSHGGRCSEPAMHRCLGTTDVPGEFQITWVSLAVDVGGNTVPQAISPLPSDLLLLGNHFATLEPRATATGVASSGDLPMRATLISAKQEKPTAGSYLRQTGLAQHLSGQKPADSERIESKQLHVRDPRLGIGLNADSRTVEEGLIYTTEGFAFSPNNGQSSSAFVGTGFLIGIEGVGDLLPEQGQLRLGGDSRSAQYTKVRFIAPNQPKLANTRFRLLLQTPALFSQGWLPEGVTRDGDESYRLESDGFSARLACAALGRREVISGWDLYHWKPKPAQSAVPTGSVYWFDEFAGDTGKLAEWVQSGLWPQNLDTMQQTRRAEGYNRALLGAWN